MRRLRTVSLVVMIMTAVLGSTITSAQAATTTWTDSATSAAAPSTTSADEPARAPAASSWIDNSQYYSTSTNYEALGRCVVVKETGNILYQTTSYLGTDDTTMVRFIQKAQLLSPTILVQFYDHCGAGRVLQPLPSARVELTTEWSDNLEYWHLCGDCISVSYPWGISFTLTPNANFKKLYAYRGITTNTASTDQFTITSTGTAASFTAQNFTMESKFVDPVYPTINMTTELTRLVIHSGDRSHAFAEDALPKKTITVW